MIDREQLIDDFIAANDMGNKGMWLSCQIAWELFEQHGAYSQDTVAVLKVACNLGYDAIYNRRNAWSEYKRLYPDSAEKGDFPSLSMSHFYRLWRKRENGFQLTDDQARKYLETAATHGWSSGELCETVDGNHDPDRERTFSRRVVKMSRAMELMISESEKMGTLGLPDSLIKQIYRTQKSIEEWIKDHEQKNSR